MKNLIQVRFGAMIRHTDTRKNNKTIYSLYILCAYENNGQGERLSEK